MATDGSEIRVPPRATERDARLAELLDRLGGDDDLETVCAAHPDLAGELRQLWATVQVARHLQRRPSPTPTPIAAPVAGLPRTFGAYELLEEIGRGGMGVVYRAQQTSLGRIVALKTILRGEQASSEELARFEAEARAVARLEHPNIVPIFEAGEQDGVAYLTMRYIEGQTLSRLLATGPLRSTDAARMLGRLARAIHYAHTQRILHRDLKPSNVLLDRDGEPHITDFGLAKLLRQPGDMDPRLTLSGSIVGTPAYIAPEQVSGRRGSIGPASDVYALGVILYEMLTGRPPFQGASPMDTLLLVLDQDPVRPSLLNPKVNRDLELICLKCLQKQPDLRYHSAEALARDLEAFLAGEPLSVRSVKLFDVFNAVLRETPNAIVLENWGLLWMIHAVTVLLLCIATARMKWSQIEDPLWYLLLWGVGLCTWGWVFWNLRKRAGPVLSVERHIAHVWGGAVLATICVFVVEMMLQPKLPVLTLTPILAAIAGITFTVKAGMLSGEFYLAAAAQFLSVIPICLYPDFGVLIFGVVTAVCFFVPGLKYHRQRLRTLAREEASRQDLAGVLPPTEADTGERGASAP
jgi:serine/threonine-protein kinase